jgi:hypothetical protein
MDRRATSAHMPFWKRGLLITTLLLCVGPLATIASSHAAYASATIYRHYQVKVHKKNEVDILNIFVACQPGENGKKGEATGKSHGAKGGKGGTCNIDIPHKILLKVEHNALQQ